MLGMQSRQPTPHGIQLIFAKRFFDTRKNFVFFEAYMVVKKFPQAPQFFRFDATLHRKSLLKIPHGGANLGVISENTHDFGISVEPNVSRISRKKHLFLFAKMHVPRFMPEADKLLCLTRNRRRAFLRGRFRRAPHLQRLNQREMVMLAKRVQTWMAFHSST
jgi:hypothetical protein